MSDAQVLHAQDVSSPTASSTTWVDSATISAGSFTAGKEYLIIGILNFQGSGNSTRKGARMVHGATPTEFTDANTDLDVIGTGERLCAAWLFRFTQPGTPEDVKIQINRQGGTGTVTCHYATIIAIKLSDDFVENTDFFWGEDTGDVSDATSLTDRSTVTLTANGSDRWLLIGQASWSATGAATEFSMCLRDSVGPATYGDENGANGYNPFAATDLLNMMFAVAIVPTAASHTFSIQTISTTTETVKSSRIIAINLAKFAQSAAIYTGASDNPTQGSFETEATLSPNPSVTGNWVIIANAIASAAVGDDLFGRLQINAAGGGLASDPAYGDDAPDQISASSTRGLHFTLATVKSLTSGAGRDINFDFQNAAAGVGAVKGRALTAFSVALVSVATLSPPFDTPARNFQHMVVR